MQNTLTGTLAGNAANDRKSRNLLHWNFIPVSRARNFHGLGLLLALILVLVAESASGQVCAHPPAGMVAWWPLDETSGTTVSDHSGLANTGTASAAIGNSTPPQSVTAHVGRGLNFYF